MRDFLEFASKYAMAIDHRNELLLLPLEAEQKTQKNNSRSRSEQKKKFKCTKFAVQTTEMSVRKGLDEGLWGGWKSLKFKQQTKTHMAPTLTQLTAPLTQNTVIIKLSTTESRQYHSAAS